MENNNSTDFTKKLYFIMFFLAVILVGFIFKQLSTVFIPVVISVLLSLVFLPVIQRIHKKAKIPWVLITILLIIALVIVIALVSTLLITSFTSILAEYPKYESKFLYIYKFFADRLNLEFDEGKSFFDNIWNQFQIRDYIQKTALSFSSGFASFGKNMLMILLLFAFLTLEMRITGNKINAAFFGKSKTRILRISNKIIQETVRYLSIKFFISLLTGVLAFLGTKIIGMDFPIVWGFLSFVMNFIPTFGSIFSVIITTLFAVLQFYPAPFFSIFIFIYMTGVNFILGNILEPRIEGKHLGLSPFVILVSLSLWGYIWGFVGMILAVPMTVIIKIICENISYFHPIAIMLGNDPAQTKKDLSAEHRNEDQDQNYEEEEINSFEVDEDPELRIKTKLKEAGENLKNKRKNEE